MLLLDASLSSKRRGYLQCECPPAANGTLAPIGRPIERHFKSALPDGVPKDRRIDTDDRDADHLFKAQKDGV
jgi:hypothetical protein